MIRLQWVKYPDGFIVVRDRPPPDVTRFDEEAEKFEEVRTASWLAPRNPNRRKTYIAEGIDQHIFLDLANVGRTDPMDESVLAFTDKWGLLDDYHYHPFPVRLSVWSAAKRLHRLVDRVQRDPASDIRKSLAFRSPEPFLEEPTLRMRWDKLAGDSAPRFFLEPRDLLQFCYAEFLQVVEGGTQIRGCPRCGKLFALGKVGQPREYCSDNCRVNMHRKRKREREQRASKVVRLRRTGSR